MATTSSVTGSATATSADLHAQSSLGPPEGAEQPVAPVSARLIQPVCGHGLRVAAAVLVGYSFAVTAWRDRLEPKDAAVVAASSLLLAALLVCLRRAERLSPDSPVGERRCVVMAVWVLSAALCGTLAYTVAVLMPHGLAVLVWCMTAFVVLLGFYLLVLCKHQHYPVLAEDDVVNNPAVELV